MARKSRKETVVLPAPEMDTTCRAGVYVRLSVEDKHTHTASIETQQLIIARYLEQNPEIIVVQTYIDNGATGTNFHRPGFQQMLSDIEAGLINCVIVKDLSRLGRNVIDTGYYIERYFPMQKVRFIAVNDRYDSSSPDNPHDGKIASRKQEIQQLRTYQRGLYEGLIQNHLSKDEYFTFKEKYEAKIEAISKEIEQLKAGLAIIAKQLEQYKMLSQDAQYIKEDRQLTAALIDRLIDRVEVSREKRITVRFRFQSEFEHCEEVLSQCRNM